MKFLPVVATSAVLFFLCATIKVATCHTNTTDQAPESPQHNATIQSPEAIVESIVQQNATKLNANTGTKRTCACDDSEETLICASNGVTYKNTCRFDCAKARVTRLRQVKQGRCSQATGASTYWQQQLKKTG